MKRLNNNFRYFIIAILSIIILPFLVFLSYYHYHYKHIVRLLLQVESEKSYYRNDSLSMDSLVTLVANDRFKFKILTRTLKDSNREVSCNAASILGFIGDTSALTPLINNLSNNDYNVIESTVEALGEMRNKRATIPIMNLFENNFDMVLDETNISCHLYIDQSIAASLIKIDDPKALTIIKKLLESKESRNKEWVIGLVGYIYSFIGDDQNYYLIRHDRDKAPLLLNNRHLLTLPLLDILNSTSEPGMDLSGVIIALGYINDPRTLKYLYPFLIDHNEEYRSYAFNSIINTTPNDVFQLISFLENPDPRIRECAARHISNSNFANNLLVMPLIRALADSTWYVRYEAIKALSIFQSTNYDETYLQILDKWVNNKNMAERLHLIDKTEKEIENEAIDDCLDYYGSRSMAITFLMGKLSNMKSYKYENILIAALKDGDWQIVSHAIEIMGRINNPRFIQPIYSTYNNWQPSFDKSVLKHISNKYMEYPYFDDYTIANMMYVKRRAAETLLLFKDWHTNLLPISQPKNRSVLIERY